MLDSISISKSLPKQVQQIIIDNLGDLFEIKFDHSNSKINILYYKDEIKNNAFQIVYADTSNTLFRKNNSDFFQPYKNNEQIKEINLFLFLNLIEFHIQRLKLSPTIKVYHETIIACD